jgi:hypothetical protein
MGTKLQELRNGCFAAAMDDEPMFVLLARDPSAPSHVRRWADDREEQIQRGAKPQSDMVKVQDARHCAYRMEVWRMHNDGAWRDGLFGTDQAAEATLSRKEAAERLFGTEYELPSGALSHGD